MKTKVIEVEIRLKDEDTKDTDLVPCYSEVLEVNKGTYENDTKIFNHVKNYLNLFYDWFNLDNYEVYKNNTNINIRPKVKLGVK